MDMMPIRILLADDHTVVRDGLRALLERQPDMTVVAEAADGRDSVRLAEEDSYDLLTDREREILQLVAEGKANKEVAGLLNISLTTVGTHRTHILQKLGLHSVPDLILYAVRKNIIS